MSQYNAAAKKKEEPTIPLNHDKMKSVPAPWIVVWADQKPNWSDGEYLEQALVMQCSQMTQALNKEPEDTTMDVEERIILHQKRQSSN